MWRQQNSTAIKHMRKWLKPGPFSSSSLDLVIRLPFTVPLLDNWISSKFCPATWKCCQATTKGNMPHQRDAPPCWLQLLPWDNTNKPMNFNSAMIYNLCFVWVHLLKFLGCQCDVMWCHVCVTLSLSRENSSMCLIQNNKDYTPNCVISWLELLQNLVKQWRALCWKPHPSWDWAYPLHKGFNEENIDY